jgi:alpha-glucosidase
LRNGGLRFLDAPEDILAFERTAPGQRLLCVFNLGPQPSVWQPSFPQPPAPGAWRVLDGVGGADIGSLPPCSGLIAQRD